MRVFRSKLKSVYNSFLTDTTGSMAIVFAITIFGLLIAAGMALDYSRVLNDRAQASNALDSAVLAAAASYQRDQNTKKAKQVAHDILSSNWQIEESYEMVLSIDADRIGGSLTSETSTTLLQLLGESEIQWKVENAVTVGGPSSIEYSLAIDISSSMAAGRHKYALQSALTEFSNAVFRSKSGIDSSVTLVPFANAVSFPAEFSNWLDPVNGLSASPSFFGCFFDEPLSRQASLSTSMPGSYVATPDLVLTTKSDTNIFCPGAETAVSLFIEDKNTLDGKIEDLEIYQGTDTAEGLSWAWRSLDYDWRIKFGQSKEFPRQYSSKAHKTIVLFTDGMPYERPWDKGKVSSAEKRKIIKRELKDFETVCNAIKADGRVNIFVIGYGNAMTMLEKDVLKSCATSSGNFYEATSSNLSEIFQSIAASNLEIALVK